LFAIAIDAGRYKCTALAGKAKETTNQRWSTGEMSIPAPRRLMSLND